MQPEQIWAFSSPPWSVAGMPLAQQQADTAMGQDTCFMGKPCLSLPPLIQTTSPFHSSPSSSAATSVAIHFSKKV
ncbi:Hypothetical predicted protein [Lynx pardinus]|uniref:Uncharacterized protein n=1 Tax=Lynx pardinus TaxID=191816 RepID=A0A485PBJ7_LYNPA|nr:Hypothetical predicted protein [Lynx pardinus]